MPESPRKRVTLLHHGTCRQEEEALLPISGAAFIREWDIWGESGNISGAQGEIFLGLRFSKKTDYSGLRSNVHSYCYLLHHELNGFWELAWEPNL